MACQGEPNARIMAFEFPVIVFRRQSAGDRVYCSFDDHVTLCVRKINAFDSFLE